MKINNESVNSIFRLIGRNENALTFALGYAFSNSTELLVNFLKQFQVLEPQKGLDYKKFFANSSISLQHYNDDKSGIKDILIESSSYRIVIEAKVDGSFPSEEQILKYADPLINKNWEVFTNNFIVLLTRRPIKVERYQKVSAVLAGHNIKLRLATWGEFFGSLRDYLFIKPVSKTDFILNELAKFLFKDYEMEIIEKEVMYRKVLKDYYHRICNRDGKGYYFDGGRDKFTYPACQFFQPCYGPARTDKKTGEFIRKIINYERLSYNEIVSSVDEEMKEAFEIHLSHFPIDKFQTDRYHVFTLGKKIQVHCNKINFSGSEKGYTDLESVLTD